MKDIIIGDRSIGSNHPPFVVAELSANHNGNIDNAKSIIREAKLAGADAIKLQTYTPDTLTIDCDKEDFIIRGGLWSGYKLYDLYKQAYTPFEWHKPLFEYCNELGITCFSSPFDSTAVDLLESLNCPAYKIASFEMIDLPLIEYVAKTGKPMIISTGMANEREIQEAVDIAKANGCEDIILLHCISSYPAPVEQSNILTVPDLSTKFDVLSGLSDHTLGTAVSIAAVALGACFIEKHFTINRMDEGPDSSFSLEPSEFTELCESTKIAWAALGRAGYERKAAEDQNTVFRRSLYIVKDLKKGDKISIDNTRSIRPGYGLPPKHLVECLGKTVIQDIERGTPLKWNHFSRGINEGA